MRYRLGDLTAFRLLFRLGAGRSAVDRLLSSPRFAGVLLLLVLVTLGVTLNLYPNFDARAEQFSGTYPDIVATGAAFPLSLIGLAATALLLGLFVIALRRAPGARDNAAVMAVSVSLGTSAGGLLAAAVLAVPVSLWAARVSNGSLTLSEGAERSQGLASASQTLILLFGLGGLALGLTILGFVAWRVGWTPAVVFWGTVALVAVTLVGGLALNLFWIGLGLPAILWTLMIGGSLIARREYPV